MPGINAAQARMRLVTQATRLSLIASTRYVLAMPPAAGIQMRDHGPSNCEIVSNICTVDQAMPQEWKGGGRGCRVSGMASLFACTRHTRREIWKFNSTQGLVKRMLEYYRTSYRTHLVPGLGKPGSLPVHLAGKVQSLSTHRAVVESAERGHAFNICIHALQVSPDMRQAKSVSRVRGTVKADLP